MNIESFIAKCLGLLPYKYILLESNPDFSDNTKSVFDELLNRNIHQKYKIVWVCRSNCKKETNQFKTVCFSNKLMRKYYQMRAKMILSCNTYIPKYTKKQIALYLGHGIALKSMKTYSAPSGIDFFVGLSDDTNRIMSQAFNCSTDKFVTLGYPRNDSLFVSKRSQLDDIFVHKYNKIVVWYPTFRQHNNPKVVNASKSALPLINNEEAAVKINNCARKLNILVVLKPHFSQDLSYIKNLKLSNILFINDGFFVEHNISSYEFVGSCDALITDYSSIYFDYLLCNKPIAAIWEDIDEYRKNRGFCIDIDYYMKGAVKVYNISEFLCFLNDLASENDTLHDERKEINNLINKYQDNKSTKRVVDLIENLLLGVK